MKFRQLMENIVDEPSPAGEQTITNYEMRMTKSGHKYLAETGTVNIYDKIQDNKNACDVKKIVQRAVMGDINAIARIKNVRDNYGDTTKIPSNLMEAQQMIIDAKKAFDQLPKEIRQKFNNNAMEFMADEGKVKEVTEQWLKDRGAIEQKPVVTETTQVKDKEEKL